MRANARNPKEIYRNVPAWLSLILAGHPWPACRQTRLRAKPEHPEMYSWQCQAKSKIFLFFIPLKGVLKRVTEIQE